MRDLFASCLTALLALVAVVICLAALSLGSWALYAWLAPKYESTRREVMLQSRAYHEGEMRNLYRLKMQFEQAPSDDEKHTIQLAARHECEAVDPSQLPPDLKEFCR